MFILSAVFGFFTGPFRVKIYLQNSNHNFSRHGAACYSKICLLPKSKSYKTALLPVPAVSNNYFAIETSFVLIRFLQQSSASDLVRQLRSVLHQVCICSNVSHPHVESSAWRLREITFSLFIASQKEESGYFSFLRLALFHRWK